MATLSTLVVSLIADTVQFDRGLGGATRTLGAFERSTSTMTRGLNVAERGLQQIAFRAIGIQGPLGKVLEGMALFTGFTGPLALVGGAIGGIALAWNAVAKSAANAQEAQARALKPSTTISYISQAMQADRFGVRMMIAGAAAPPGRFRVLNRFLAQQENMRYEDEPHSALMKTLAAGNIPEDRLFGASAFEKAGWFRTAGQRGMPFPAFGAGGFTASTAASDLQARFDQMDSELGKEGALTGGGMSRTIGNLQLLSSSIMLLGSVAGKSGTAIGNAFIGAGGIAASQGTPVAAAVGAGLGIFGGLINLFSKEKPLPVSVENFNEMEQVRRRAERVSITVVSNLPWGEIREQFEQDAERASRRGVVYLPKPRGGTAE